MRRFAANKVHTPSFLSKAVPQMHPVTTTTTTTTISIASTTFHEQRRCFVHYTRMVKQFNNPNQQGIQNLMKAAGLNGFTNPSSFGGSGGGDNNNNNNDSSSSSDGTTSTAGGKQNSNPIAQVGFGAVMVSVGIILVNLNERRAKKQDDLNDICEARLLSLNDDSDEVPKAQDAIEDKLLHSSGDVFSTEPWASDNALRMSFPNMLRADRKVEMYQWRETKHEHTDEKTKEKTVTYTYSQEWSEHHLSTRDNRNPSFPSIPRMTNFPKEIQMKVQSKFTTFLLKFSQNFKNRLEWWAPWTDCAPTDGGASARGYGLALLPDNSGFYSANGSPGNPRIGDVRVTYRAVHPGEYTILGKYKNKEGIIPFTAALKQSLASENALVVPKEAKSFFSQIGEAFVAPDWLVSLVEDTMLSVTPIEYAFIEPGAHSKTDTTRHHRHLLDETTDGIAIVGGILIVFGVFVAVAVTSPIVGSSVSTYGGLATGIGIYQATRKGARDQVRGPNYVAPNYSDKKSDVTL